MESNVIVVLILHYPCTIVVALLVIRAANMHNMIVYELPLAVKFKYINKS